MNTPSGYTALDLIGFTDRGAYDSTANYVKNDLTHDLSNKIWRCLIDDTHGVAPAEGVNWTLFIDSQTALSGMSDVQITTPATGEALVYDGTASKWKNELLADVALSGDYDDLMGLPTLGTAAAKDSTNAVTQGSTDLVESGAVYSALADKANTADLATVATSGAYSDLSGTPSLATVATSGSYNDLLNKPTLGTAAAKDSTNAVTQNSTDLVESGAVYTEVNSVKTAFTNNVKNNGSKNAFAQIDALANGNGITYSRDSNGVITWSGTLTASFTTVIVGLVHLKAGETYKLTGGIDTDANLSLRYSNGDMYQDNTDSKQVVSPKPSYAVDTFTANQDADVNIVLRIARASTASDEIKAMICLKSDWDLDNSYVPPAKTNRQLTEDSVTWTDEAQIGAVNYLKTNISTQVLGGVTLTANADGSYNCSGNVAANSNNRVDSSPITLKKGTYIFYCSSDAHSPVGNGNCFAFIYGMNGTSAWTRSYITNAGNDGSCGVFTLTQDSTITFGVCCFNNTGSAVAVNTTFYPGIYPASYNGPYVPYAKTNKELTDELATYKSGEKLDEIRYVQIAGVSNAAGTQLALYIPLPKRVQSSQPVTSFTGTIGWARGSGTSITTGLAFGNCNISRPNLLELVITGTFSPLTVYVVELANLNATV